MRGEGDVIKLPGEEKRGEENKGERRGSVGPVTKALTNLTATASCSRFDGRLEKTDRLGWKERTVVPLVDRRGHSSQTFFHMRSRSPAEQPVWRRRRCYLIGPLSLGGDAAVPPPPLLS